MADKRTHTVSDRYPPKQKRRSMSGVFLQLVPLAGIELATFALRMRCSTN
jgi:hypothetical protein